MSNTTNTLATRASILATAYTAAYALLGKDTAWRIFSYIPTIGAELTETALQSLVEAGFINPLSKEFLVKARYVGAATIGAITFTKGIELLTGSVQKLRNIDIITKPFTVKQYWHNHPNRLLLTKQQTAALGISIVVAAALLAGSDRTSWAVDRLSQMPSHTADYLLSSLNITKEGWFSSDTTPKWAKWAVGVPLVAGGWWAINTAASGVLWGVNRVLKGTQTPVEGTTYEDRYYKLDGEYYDYRNKAYQKLDKAKETTREYRDILDKLITNIAPGLKGQLEGLAKATADFFKKESEEEK